MNNVVRKIYSIRFRIFSVIEFNWKWKCEIAGEKYQHFVEIEIGIRNLYFSVEELFELNTKFLLD